MKIACISTTQIPSSRANSLQVMKVCQALVQNGNEVRLYIPGNKPPDWDELKTLYGLNETFTIIPVKSWRMLRRMDFNLVCLAMARRWQSDLVYTRMLWVSLFARLTNLPAVLEMHDLPTGTFGPVIYKAFLRSKNPGLVVYITQALKNLSDDRMKIQAQTGEFVIAPDGVDLERYENLPRPAQARAQLGLDEAVTAVYSGGFYAGRGLELLQRLAQAFPQVRFLWVGGTPEQVSAWQQKLGAAGITNVKLTGFIRNSQLPLYQAAADVLLMPYSRSFAGSGGGDISAVSSPMKLFEYMAAGRSILVSDLPVFREVLNEKNAAFYQPEDFADLCSNFAALITDEAMRGRLAAAARHDVKAYSWKNRMAGILRVYKETTIKE